MITVSRCKDCGKDTIQEAICNVDKVLSVMGSNNYYNHIYALDKPFNSQKFMTLQMYKEILQKKLFDCDYTNFPTSQIISKVKEHLYG